MAITVMCSATDEGTYAILPKDAANMGWRGTNPLYMHTTHAGLVLSLREMNGYDDSDFYALVWDDATGCTKEICYASTRGWTYPNHAEIDATPEILAAYNAWGNARAEANRIELAKLKAAMPTIGKVVRVVKGRKVPVGTQGEVFWYSTDKFTRSHRYFDDGRHGYRVGIRTADGTKLFTSAENCEVVA